MQYLKLLHHVDNDSLFHAIRDEHPQIIAVVASCLPPDKASHIIKSLPPETQISTALRIASMGSVEESVLNVLEKEIRLSVSNTKHARIGGLGALTAILTNVDPSTQCNLLDNLSQVDPDFAAAITARLRTEIRIPDSIEQYLTPDRIKILLKDAVPTEEEIEEILRNHPIQSPEDNHRQTEPTTRPLFDLEDSTENKARVDRSQNEVDRILDIMMTTHEETASPKLAKEQIKALQVKHEKCAHMFEASLTKRLRNCIEVKLLTVKTMHYANFVFGLDNPSFFNVLEFLTPQGSENAILDINPPIARKLIDMLLGGGREYTASRKPPTNIETKLLRSIIDEFLNVLFTAWTSTFSVIQTESDPRAFRKLEPTTPVIVFCFEIATIEGKGWMSLMIPLNALEKTTAG